MTHGTQLPDGWSWTTLGDVTQINGRDPNIRNLPDDLLVTFLPMSAVNAEQGAIAQPEVRQLKDVRKGFTPFSNGDVLFAKITPSMENGKAAIARNLINERGFGSTEFHVFKPLNKVTSEWIFHFIRQEHFRKDAKAHFAGTAGQLRVPANFLIDYPIPLPPLPEQARIVERIESLFTQLDAGVAGLKRAQAALKRYKASVLKAACEGRLVDGNPEEWRWVTVGDVGSVKGGKRLPAGHAYSERSTKFPYIRVVDFGETTVNAKELKYLLPATQQKIKQYTISKDDVYVSIAGSIGKVGFIPEKLDGANLTENAAKITELQGVDNKFLAYILCSPMAQEQISVLTISTNQPKLALFRIEKIQIPLPPINEQLRIVAEVERRLSVVKELEQTVETNLKRSGRLRQAILKRAFEGRLVEQDPQDIPV